MKVLSVYRYLTVGGVESVIRARLEALPSMGVNSVAWFLADAGGGRHFGGLGSRIRVGGVLALQRYLLEETPEIVTSFDTPEVLALAAVAVPGARRVLEAHTPYKENLEYLRSLPADSAETVFVPSEYQKRTVEAILPHPWPIHVVPNPLSFRFGVDNPSAPVLNRPIVAWIGRLDFLKHWDLALRIFARVRAQGPSPELWLIGSVPGPRTVGEVYELSRRLGILGRLRWFKRVRYDAMPAAMATVRRSGGVVLSTSRGESFGMVVAEAMASGCLVVAPNREPFTELLAHRVTGLLYRPGSERNGAEMVSHAINDLKGSRRMANRAQQEAWDRFRQETALPQLVSILRRLVPSTLSTARSETIDHGVPALSGASSE